MDITYIHGLGILIFLFFHNPRNNIGLQLLKLDKTPIINAYTVDNIKL